MKKITLSSGRVCDPTDAMDFIHADVHTKKRFVIWANNGVFWPRGGRHLSFLGSRRQHAIKGFHLLTGYFPEAKLFDTREEAEAWAAKEVAKRNGNKYMAEISTVEDMINANFDVDRQRMNREDC